MLQKNVTKIGGDRQHEIQTARQYKIHLASQILICIFKMITFLKKLTKIDGFGKKTFAICWVTNVLDIAAVERPKGQFK